MNRTDDSAAAEVKGSVTSSSTTVPSDTGVGEKKQETKKNKNKHSADRRFMKVLRRQQSALNAALERYVELRDKSAGKKKDGALKDKNKNMFKALKLFKKKSKKTPSDLVKAYVKSKELPKKSRKRLEKAFRKLTLRRAF